MKNMKKMKDLINVIYEEFRFLKNKILRKNVVEGFACEPGKVEVDGECFKEVSTLNMFFIIPIANCIVVAIMSFFMAGMLFKIKNMPLALHKNGKKCTFIPPSKIFRKNILEGSVHEEVYKNRSEKAKFNKIVFPYLTKFLYPDKAEIKPQKLATGESRPMFTFSYKLFLPIYMTFKIATTIWYTPLTMGKLMFYKHFHWGTLPEIAKINKKLWIYDLLTVFLLIPFKLFIIFPFCFLGSIVVSTLVAPLYSFMLWLQNRGGKMYFYNRETESKLSKVWQPIKYFLNVIGWFLLFGMMGSVAFVFVFASFFIWLGGIIFGTHEGKRDGMETVVKTWANIVWDFKYIWAIIAVAIWTYSFKVYLKGEQNILTFVNDDNRDLTVGLISGIVFIALLGQQGKYFKFLSKSETFRKRGCHPNCEPPPITPKEDGLTKKCPPRSKAAVKV